MRVARLSSRLLLALIGAAGLLVAGCNQPTSPSDGTPADITDLSVTTGQSRIALEWTDPGDADFDHVRIAGHAVEANQAKVPKGQEQYEATGLRSGTEYTFTLKAVDTQGDVSSGITRTVGTDVAYSLDASWESALENDGLVSQASPASAQSESPAIDVAGSFELDQKGSKDATAVVIKYRDDVVRSQSLQESIEQYGKERTIRSSEAFRLSRVEVDESQGHTLGEAIEYYESLPQVEYAERDSYYYAFGKPNDPKYPLQWNFSQLNMPSVWTEVTGEQSVVVAVVDSGIAYDLEDIDDTNFAQGTDFVNHDIDPYDDASHGTHVAGTIAQETNNGTGTAGMAYDVSLMPVKVLDQNGDGTVSDVAAGITWAVDNGADVINLSLGSGSSDQTMKDAVRYAHNRGVAVIAATGNTGGFVDYPAAYDEYVLAVGATEYGRTRAQYSNYGSKLDVVAPGGNTGADANNDGEVDGILQQTIKGYDSIEDTTDYTPGYYFREGTSMAAPHVSALAALLVTKNETLTPDEIFDAIRNNAQDLGPSGKDDEYGYGLIDPAATLSENPWRVTDTREATVNSTENPKERWKLQVADGTISATVGFQHAAANLDLYLLDPSGEVVAHSTSETDNESISYSVGGNTGTYTLELRFAD